MGTDALRTRLRGWLEGLGGEPGLVVYTAAVVLVAAHYQGSTHAFRVLFKQRFDDLAWVGALPYLWWFGASIFFYLAVPLLVARVAGASFSERYGFQLGDWRLGLKLSALFLAVMLPATWVASTLPAFRDIYPLAGKVVYLAHANRSYATFSWPLFLTYELGYAAYFFAWEFLFRGWLLHGVAPRWGKGPAILLTVVPFAVMHLGKAELEALGSIVAAVALGVLSVQTRSFYYGVLLHAAVAIWMDVLAVAARGA